MRTIGSISFVTEDNRLRIVVIKKNNETLLREHSSSRSIGGVTCNHPLGTNWIEKRDLHNVVNYILYDVFHLKKAEKWSILH